MEGGMDSAEQHTHLYPLVLDLINVGMSNYFLTKFKPNTSTTCLVLPQKIARARYWS